MADWVIDRVEESVVLSYRDAPRGEGWALFLTLPGESLSEVIAWVMTRQNPAAGDRIVLPCGGVLFPFGVRVRRRGRESRRPR